MVPGLHVGGAIVVYVVLVLTYLILPFFRREVYAINLVSLLIFSVLGAFATRSVTDEHYMVAAMEAAFVLEPFPYFQRIHTYEHVWQWLDGPFQSAIFETDIDASGSIMTFNRLVGAIRLSQQTVEPERCSEGRDGRVVKICYPDTGDDYPVRNAEDVEDVKPIEVNGSLRLTRESVNSTLTTLRDDKHWFDASTRALIVSFSTYNYNCNLFVSLTFMLNQRQSGAVDPWCARVHDATPPLRPPHLHRRCVRRRYAIYPVRIDHPWGRRIKDLFIRAAFWIDASLVVLVIHKLCISFDTKYKRRHTRAVDLAIEGLVVLPVAAVVALRLCYYLLPGRKPPDHNPRECARAACSPRRARPRDRMDRHVPARTAGTSISRMPRIGGT